MNKTEDQYHHYIPRFILRNFAIDNYERVFVRGKKLLKQQKRQKRQKPELIQTYDRKINQLGISPIGRTYGIQNMYRDLNNENVMHVEDKLRKLERQASKVIRDIINESQVESQVIL